VEDWLDYVQRTGEQTKAHRVLSAATKMRHAVREDHATLRRYSEKYGGRDTEKKDLPKDALVRIGFQIMVAVRLMHFFRDAGMTPLAMVASRLIRHMYGSDIHWDARFEPGVQIVHAWGSRFRRRRASEKTASFSRT